METFVVGARPRWVAAGAYLRHDGANARLISVQDACGISISTRFSAIMSGLLSFLKIGLPSFSRLASVWTA